MRTRTSVDLSGEIRDLADAVAELEDELEVAADELAASARANEQLRLELEEAENALAFAESDVELYELLADVKRGLMTFDELLDRTVGR